MPNYKLTIEYEGTNYHGWQRQKSKVTVQEVIEKTLEKIFKQKITLMGQGRIDAGAHALGQVANFKVYPVRNRSSAIASVAGDRKEISPARFRKAGGKAIPISNRIHPLNLKKALNSMLPLDIRIKDAQIADDKFHARYSARTRHYRYIVYNDELSVWLRKFAYFYPYYLNIKQMKEGAKWLLGKHDFSCFQSTGSPVKSTVKTIKSVEIKKENLNFPGKVSVIKFDIEADAFLYRMVRNMVGALLEIGRGKIPPDEIEEILKGRTKRRSQTIPAYGLYLIDVKY